MKKGKSAIAALDKPTTNKLNSVFQAFNDVFRLSQHYQREE